MKKIVSTIVSVLVVCGAVQAKYKVQSEYLKNPEANIDFIIKQADLFEKAEDKENGGFYQFLTRDGQPAYPDEVQPEVFYYWNWINKVNDPDFSNGWLAGVDPYNEFTYHLKSITCHSRAAYQFAKAFQVSGDEKYLELADKALDFLYKHGWNRENDGGWWFSTDAEGNPAAWLPGNWWEPNSWKWSYQQMYPLIGIGAVVEATGGTKMREGMEDVQDSISDLQWYSNASELFSDIMWDDTPGREGYYMDADLDWSNKRNKSFTGIGDAITTHATHLYMLTRDPAHFARMVAVADQAVEHLVGSLGTVPWGNVTDFDSDWNAIDGGNVSIGHIVKTAWIIARVYQFDPKPEYREGAAALIKYVLENGGYDFENGGLYSTAEWTYDSLGNAEVNIVENKGSWQLEQGLTAGLMNYSIAETQEDKDLYLKMADESIDFFHNHFVDTEYGGHWLTVSKTGDVVDSAKAEMWDQGYHGAELAYLAYLYGSTFVNNKPFTLYYYFEPQDEAREIQLNPFEGVDGAVEIKRVSIDGKRFRAYNKRSRTLSIAPGVGGKFKVIFKSTFKNKCDKRSGKLLKKNERASTKWGKSLFDGSFWENIKKHH
ncbi:MAG: AGE family epimerase/isomerase [Fibrobacterales bacterium]